MALLSHELRLFLRQRIALPALLLMAVLSVAAVWAGSAEVSRQRQVISQIQPQQDEDVAAIRNRLSEGGDAGYAAYYTMHATWDSPSSLAFAALGQRDVAPYVLRVRALALESQIYEGENYNAELALPGRFDWAFVLTYLAPLFLIVLMHDLVSGEREAGRLGLLRVMARQKRMLWARRIGLRGGLLFAAVGLPMVGGAALSGAAMLDVFALLALAALYLLFWALVCLMVAWGGMSSIANAATLAAVWLALTLIAPAFALLAINDALPVKQGVELTLSQREAVHSGWDEPKEVTMNAFFPLYPEWRHTRPVDRGFHWKWYFAFQHLGDVSVAAQTRAYREGLEARDRWTRRLGIVLPAVGVQFATHRLAATDLTAQLAYQDRIRAFHERLRRFYYPYLFNEAPFRDADFARAPQWQEPVLSPRAPAPSMSR